MSKSQLSRLSDQVPEIKRLQERVVELEGLLVTAYETAAKVAEGCAPIVAGNFFRGQREMAAKIADRIRSLAPAPVERIGHDEAQKLIAAAVREIEILCDQFGYDPCEWLAGQEE